MLLVPLFSVPASYANNVSVSNVELVEQDSTADTIKIEFDVTWSNAWFDSINHDAVWVFAKYCTSSCTSAGATWTHVKLDTGGTNPTNFSRGTKGSGNFSSINILVPSDKIGAIVRPAQQGSGTLDIRGIQFVWDYGTDGVADATVSATTTRVRLYAIEMTYITEGGFYAGDGSNGNADYEAQFEYGTGTQNIIPAVNSESGISFRSNSTDAWYYNSGAESGEAADGTIFDLSTSFPKGYKAFYLMKYELGQGQLRDFLNSLTTTPFNKRIATTTINNYAMTNSGTVTSRSGIKYTAAATVAADFTSGGGTDQTNDGEWIAANYLSWMDLAAYADWAGLRPMSELEFEKTARGPIYPVDGEHTWGSTSLTEAATLSSSGQTGEIVSESGNGLVNYNNSGNGVDGPARSGFAATSTTGTRAKAGAGYYGNMELSGNLWEQVVTVGNATGRGFSGSHGDGALTSVSSYEGNATNLDWPGVNTTSQDRGITAETGSGLRGGTFSTGVAASYELEISNRHVAAAGQATRLNSVGGRLARTSPEYD